ncbi:MAG TPA: hypothetical protein VMW16_03675 [Sedimentisphaerales bacterium]|nr:hypothetical protein [Sedimentisphaerales bacterium]
MASARVRWCGHFGVWIQEQGKIITPPENIVYPSMLRMAGSFAMAAARHVASGFRNRTPAEQAQCRAICEACPYYVRDSKLGPRCRKCGCCVSLARRWATKRCPEGKWPINAGLTSVATAVKA